MQDPSSWDQLARDDVKVPVVLGVMSRCPDALLCEAVFDQVLPRAGSKIDLSLTYLGVYVLFLGFHAECCA